SLPPSLLRRASSMRPYARPSARSAAALLLAGAALAACKKKPEVAPTPAPVAAMPTVDSAAIRDSIARAARERQAALARQRAYDDSVRRANEAAAMAAEQNAMRSTITAVIHFDFDKSDLRDDARSILDAKIPLLLANQDVAIRIAGNTDERGSTEYNLALG